MNPSTREEQLWRELGDLFAEDDGSLPEIRLIEVSADGAANIFDELCSRAEPLETNQTVWLDEREQELPLRDVPDAGALAATGRISTLHVVLRGIRSRGTRIPDLGVSIWPGEVALDYRMGSGWNADVLAAFVELLGELRKLDPGARLAAAGELDLMPKPVQQRFQRAIDRYFASTD
jgi:hypothetical protein